MRLQRLISLFPFVIIPLLIWALFVYHLQLQYSVECDVQTTKTLSSNCDIGLFQSNLGCCPQKVCPVDHYSFFLRSGTGNMVGPKICVNNKIIMGGVLNNVAWGLNIVLVQGKTGKLLKSSFFSIHSKGLLDFLKVIQAGNIILVASYDDPAVCLTDEIREIFAGLGSTSIHSVKHRDTWLFAGVAGMKNKSQIEKFIANDEKSNAYGEWPEMGEVGGCFPRMI